MRTYKEYYRYRAEGPFAYIVNTLTRANVAVTELKIVPGGCEFTLRASDKDRAVSALEAAGRKCTELKRDGAKYRVKNFFLRYAFVFGLIISFTAVAVYANTIDGIRVEGAERLDTRGIEEVCSEYASFPCFRGGIALDEVKKAVLGMEGVAYASVTTDGRSLVVKVIEELPKTVIEDTLNPIPLTANESGVITRIAVYRGTPAVAPGDSVNAGDVLVYPYIGSAEEARKSVKALGCVEARVVRSEIIEYASDEEYEAHCAHDVEERVNAFKANLGENDIFTGSRFSAERLDKTVVVSIYYEIITNIA